MSFSFNPFTRIRPTNNMINFNAAAALPSNKWQPFREDALNIDEHRF